MKEASPNLPVPIISKKLMQQHMHFIGSNVLLARLNLADGSRKLYIPAGITVI